MAFDLVHYFSEQIKSQKPQLFSQYSASQKNEYITEMNALTLGKLISLWRTDELKTYQEIHAQDPLYVRELARHLTTSKHNQSELDQITLEHANTEFLMFQFAELKQLDDTGHYGQHGIGELLSGQIEHLSGQAKDWVWQTNALTELIGSQPTPSIELLSLDDTMKEFNQMVHGQTENDLILSQKNEYSALIQIPIWSKLIEPILALFIIAGLYCVLQKFWG